MADPGWTLSEVELQVVVHELVEAAALLMLDDEESFIAALDVAGRVDERHRTQVLAALAVAATRREQLETTFDWEARLRAEHGQDAVP